MTEPERLQALEDAGIERVTLKLARSVKWSLTKLRLGRASAVGLEVNDLVQEALERFLDGRWEWEPTKSPDLADFLKYRIRGLISNALDLAEYRRVGSLQSASYEDREQRSSTGREDVGNLDDLELIGVGRDDQHPEHALKRLIDDATAKKFWDRLEREMLRVPDAQLKGELARVLSAIREGTETPGKIAESLSLDQGAVYRRLYKLESLAATVANDLLGDDEIASERGDGHG
jgi:DNA-directed RNA polymerase specialized sigma24 family protein